MKEPVGAGSAPTLVGRGWAPCLHYPGNIPTTIGMPVVPLRNPYDRRYCFNFVTKVSHRHKIRCGALGLADSRGSMFRGAARRFLSGAATKAKVRSLPLRPSRIAIVTGSLYCFYAIPTAYLDAASSDPPPSSAERHSPRADIIRKLDESRPRLNPESLIQSRITEYEYFLKMEYDGTGIVGCHVNETPR
jgi:hypothetical protein